ncbi:MAG: trypsin-like serine peptidase [Qingshengfaniella sp.]
MTFFLRLAPLLLPVLLALPAGAETLRQGMSATDQNRWLAVGRLNIAGQGFCTATLVAPDLVLTAAHCLVDKRTQKRVAPERVNFLAGYRSGQFAAHGKGAQVTLVEGFSRVSQTVSRDLGLVRLSRPMPPRIRPLPVVFNLHPGDRLEVMSYAIDRSQLPSWQEACEVLQRNGSLVFTSCEGVPGVSGAPLIRETVAGPRLAGVASSIASRSTKRPAKGNIVAIALDPGLTDPMLHRLGRSRKEIIAMR